MFELVHSLGIEWKVLVAQIVNFAILFFILRRFAWKPIMDLLNKREERLKADKKSSEEVLTRVTEIERLKIEMLDKARIESQKIVREGENVATKIKEELMAEAHKEFERIVASARKQTEDNLKIAEMELKQNIGELLALAVEKSVGDAFDKHAHQKLVDEAKVVIGGLSKVRM